MVVSNHHHVGDSEALCRPLGQRWRNEDQQMVRYFKLWLGLIFSRKCGQDWYFCLLYLLFVMGLPNMTVQEIPYRAGVFLSVMLGVAVAFSTIAVFQLWLVERGRKQATFAERANAVGIHRRPSRATTQIAMNPANQENLWPPNP